jgi:hypothetical protein
MADREHYIAKVQAMSTTDAESALATIKECLLDIYERIGNLRSNDAGIVRRLDDIERKGSVAG